MTYEVFVRGIPSAVGWVHFLEDFLQLLPGGRKWSAPSPFTVTLQSASSISAMWLPWCANRSREHVQGVRSRRRSPTYLPDPLPYAIDTSQHLDVPGLVAIGAHVPSVESAGNGCLWHKAAPGADEQLRPAPLDDVWVTTISCARSRCSPQPVGRRGNPVHIPELPRSGKEWRRAGVAACRRIAPTHWARRPGSVAMRVLDTLP